MYKYQIIFFFDFQSACLFQRPPLFPVAADESPTASPRTDDDDTSCGTSDDSEQSSVAVACPLGQPAEIIVKGSKVCVRVHDRLSIF